MVSKEVQKRIRQIEIHTKRLLSGSLVGQSSSAVKGAGFEFDQIRVYQPGDDVRFIDWKSSARSTSLMTRQYIEERSRTIILAVDISASSFFGSSTAAKYTMMSEIAAVLALVAEVSKDHVGLLLFANKVHLFVPPNSGRKHVRYILEQLFSVTPKQETTSVAAALEHIARLHLKNVVAFFISDFISAPFDRPLSVVAKRYELIAVRCLDVREMSFDPIGFLPVMDMESGEQATLNVRRKKGKTNLFLTERLHEQNRLFRKYAVDMLQIQADQPYMQEMVRFFKKRLLY